MLILLTWCDMSPVPVTGDTLLSVSPVLSLLAGLGYLQLQIESCLQGMLAWAASVWTSSVYLSCKITPNPCILCTQACFAWPDNKEI